MCILLYLYCVHFIYIASFPASPPRAHTRKQEERKGGESEIFYRVSDVKQRDLTIIHGRTQPQHVTALTPYGREPGTEAIIYDDPEHVQTYLSAL